MTPGIDWDHRTRTEGVYRIVSPKHRGWSRHVDRELGNYDYLLGADVRRVVNLFARITLINLSEDRPQTSCSAEGSPCLVHLGARRERR